MVTNSQNPNDPRTLVSLWLLPTIGNQNSPPPAPNDGDRYRVTAVATGAWTGKENTIAVYDMPYGVWRFETLTKGMVWRDQTSNDWHYMNEIGNVVQFDKLPIAISDVSGLQTVLDGKSAIIHAANHVSGGSDPLTGNLDAVARHGIGKNGAAVTGSRRAINLIEGANISITLADNPGSERVDATITASVGGNHNLLDGVVDQDTTNSPAVRGSMIVANATPKWTVLALGAVGTYPRSNGTDLVFSALQSADIIAALGYTPENPANYDTANNPATLDGSAKVKASQLNNVGQATVTIAGVTDTLEHFLILGMA